MIEVESLLYSGSSPLRPPGTSLHFLPYFPLSDGSAVVLAATIPEIPQSVTTLVTSSTAPRERSGEILTNTGFSFPVPSSVDSFTAATTASSSSRF